MALTLIVATMASILLGNYATLLKSRGRKLPNSISEPPLQRSEQGAQELFGCLLSANLAVLENDNFDRIESSLSSWKARRALTKHWGIWTTAGLRKTISVGFDNAGQTSEDEREALEAWASNRETNCATFWAIRDIVLLMATYTAAIPFTSVRLKRFSLLAWDIQQLAYIVRLGTAAGMLSVHEGRDWLRLLADKIRCYYSNWHEYSLNAIVGRCIKHPVDWFRLGQWTELVATHDKFLALGRGAFAQALPWSQEAQSAKAQRSSESKRPS